MGRAVSSRHPRGLHHRRGPDAIRQYTIVGLLRDESGSDRVLRLMGKGATVRQVEEAVERCREHGLRVAGSFIVGYPGETERDYEATKDLIAALSLDDVFVSSGEPIPATPLADLVVRTPRDKNPAFVPHTGEYRPLGLTESEARCFDLMMHADMFRPQLRLVTERLQRLSCRGEEAGPGYQGDRPHPPLRPGIGSGSLSSSPGLPTRRA